jgi:EF-hand domain/EF hand
MNVCRYTRITALSLLSATLIGGSALAQTALPTIRGGPPLPARSLGMRGVMPPPPQPVPGQGGVRQGVQPMQQGQMPSGRQMPFNFGMFGPMGTGMPALGPALSAAGGAMQPGIGGAGYPMSGGYGMPGQAGGMDQQSAGVAGAGEQQAYSGQRLENRSLETQTKPTDPVDRLVQQMDNDGDGKISSKEAKGLFLEFFDKFDLDHDGYLQHDEVEAALRHYPILLTGHPAVSDTNSATARNLHDANNVAPRASQTSSPPR